MTTSRPFPPPAEAWCNRFATLGPAFFTELPAQALPHPHWVATSDACATLLGWPADTWATPDALAVFSGHTVWPGMRPLASVYSGHQFGQWAGRLGDGRALLLGEVDTPHGPQEIQLKGAGRTPYSRMGDGRAVLRSSIREFLCSEAMHALGIPTTRALCLVGSPEPVRRERVETAAVVARVAPSFLRFGHFEHFAHSGQHAALRQLFEFTLTHHFPACRDSDAPALAFLREVTQRTADLLAQWQAVGFCHGVMNTDNMSVLGLTLDYGPFGFLDAHDPEHICNHSDTSGRYAYAHQPHIAWWNLYALAQALVPLVGSGEGEPAEVERIRAELDTFSPTFEARTRALWQAKLGLRTHQAEDRTLVRELLTLMTQDRADHTITLRRLGEFSTAPDARNDRVRDLFLRPEAFDAWAQRYAARLRAEGSVDAERQARMADVNPKYVLRNHLAEEAIVAAEAGDFSGVQRLLKVLQRPFDEQPEHDALAGFPPDWAGQLQVSCSS